MPINYQALEKTARRLIKENGRAASIRTLSKSGPAHNPTVTPNDQPITTVIADFQAHERDDTVERGDKKALVAAGFEIDTTMQLIDESLTYNIVNVRKIKPGSTTILYILQVRV